MSQPNPVKGKQSVTEHLIEYIKQREQKGIKTYGRSLETFNGRNPIQDLKEELIDGLQYAEQWEMEREELLKQIKEYEAMLDRIAHRETFIKLYPFHCTKCNKLIIVGLYVNGLLDYFDRECLCENQMTEICKALETDIVSFIGG